MTAAKDVIAIIEDDPLIATDLFQRLRHLTKYDGVIFESLVDFKSASKVKWKIVFCNLHLTDGWLSQDDLLTVMNHAALFVLFTGYADWSAYDMDLHVHVLVLHKPFTTIELMKMLDL